MPVHDWTRVEDGIFHHFHTLWVAQIPTALNRGILPRGYYALAEQIAGRRVADMLTLHASDAPSEALPRGNLPPDTGGTVVAQAPPKVQRRQTVESLRLARRRAIAVRHVSGHRLVALLEIVSPGNKDRASTVEEFADKAVEALDLGVHLMVIDLLPPGPFDPQGMHGAILGRLQQLDQPYDLPASTPLTLASYAAGPSIEIYLEHLAAGAALPEMPLFLRPDRYVNVPLEATYREAYAGMPEFWRNVLEGRENG